METKIIHRPERHRFETVKDGYTAYVEYSISDNGLNILHTIVPDEISGQGIASQLVKEAYDYARKHSLKPVATCSYEVAWLEKHKDYKS